MKLAVVILNWNGKTLLETFLPSVVKHSQNATVYVADNASTDDSLAFIKSHFPLVKIIKNKSNGGYAKGYNDALKHIEEPLFCLLNSDVEVTENWLDPIISTFKTEPETAIIQPKILDYNKKSHFEYAGAAGGFIDKYGYPYCRGRIFNTIEADTKQYNDSAHIFWASGACFFIRREAYTALNGFDESFFAHMEEIDLCWRAYNLDYKVKYVGASTVYHVGGATLNAVNPKKTFLNFRNSLFCLTKNAPGNLFLLIFTRLVLDGLAAFKFLLTLKLKHIIAILKAHFSFYLHLSSLLKKRRKNSKVKGYYSKNSIVWLYFAKKKRFYRNL